MKSFQFERSAGCRGTRTHLPATGHFVDESSCTFPTPCEQKPDKLCSAAHNTCAQCYEDAADNDGGVALFAQLAAFGMNQIDVGLESCGQGAGRRQQHASPQQHGCASEGVAKAWRQHRGRHCPSMGRVQRARPRLCSPAGI